MKLNRNTQEPFHYNGTHSITLPDFYNFMRHKIKNPVPMNSCLC